eukprot:TRINITY_DN6829_c0_g1_i1.p1 TRINITY_DN6829_c0_g1~~TRINITY_DN6829_c0_g1_i1.p1  ORF type:complete len:181 (-),score=28.45 TRINITY_DN6829_c0_g1_i1:128-670(-)
MGHTGQQRTAKKTFGKTKKTIVRGKQSTKTGCKLRASITPGTVLILLAGRFRGRRVVFLNQLESGLLLVTGPFAVNGVPLRRVNQRYCIATSTKVDLKGSDYTSISDKYFAREAKSKQRKDESSFFASGSEKAGMPEERKVEIKKMDEKVVKAIGGGDVESYLKSRFSLTANMYPHEMKF